MKTKVQFLCRGVSGQPSSDNSCLQNINDVVNTWLEHNPCNVLDIKYNEVVSSYQTYNRDDSLSNFRFPYTEYISVMITYNDDI